MRRLARPSALLLSLALAGGCSTAAIERRTLPAALADHVRDLPTFDPTSSIVVPGGLAWNTTISGIRTVVPIAAYPQGSGTILTHARYREDTRAGVRTQTRARFSVSFQQDVRRGLVPEVGSSVEARSRTVCGPATAFVPSQQVDGAVADAIGAALGALYDVPFDQFVFDADPATLAGQFAETPSDHYDLVKGVGPDGIAYVDGTGRISGAQRRDVQIEVQSRFRASFVPAAGGTRLVVEAYLEHRTSDDDTVREFVSDDASRVVEGVYGMVARHAPLRDLVLADQAPAFPIDPPVAEPDLAPAVEDMRGAFSAQILLAAAPFTRADSTAWDATTEVRPMPLPGQGRAAPGDPRMLAAAARAAVARIAPSPFDASQAFYAYVGSATSQTAYPWAPELSVRLAGNGVDAQTDVVVETYAAIFPERPLTLALSGETNLVLSMLDDDPATPGMVGPDGAPISSTQETIAEVGVSARALVEACRPSCVELGGGLVCLTLTRMP